MNAQSGRIRPKKLKVRTIFLSDLHLGLKHAQADKVLEFLRHTECETLYLVGDIVDNWALKRSWFWTQPNNNVIQKILRLARKGTKVIYIPGNHDEQFRSFCGQNFGVVAVREEAIHKGADGRKYLVLHGDKFDGVVLNAKWLAHLGSWAYNTAMRINVVVNRIRRLFRMRYWSLSAYLKRRVKSAVEFIGNYEEALVRDAREHDAQGVICGHIHTAEFRDIDGILYGNCGDWVESCTAIVENFDGSLELIEWMVEREKFLAPQDINA
jgi:UDP-2,3-diacylglucosamine pyrophosphatase LpxH